MVPPQGLYHAQVCTSEPQDPQSDGTKEKATEFLEMGEDPIRVTHVE